MNNYNFLQDKRFLQQLDRLRIKEQFVKITVLNWKEEPLKQIQGIAINGSVNLDGSSSMRRTASLSIFAEEKENNLANIDSLFSINKKCFLEVGIINKVPMYNHVVKDEHGNISNNIINYQNLYGNIVWFPLGLFIMFNPSLSHSLEGVTINMQLKDKMCLLNGDLGGQIHSSVEFSYQDKTINQNNGISVEKKPVLIFNIIKELVNHWGNEDLNKIIISQVPLQIKQVVKWMGNQNIWLVKGEKSYYTLETTKPETDIKYEFQPGQDVGFIYTDFVYPGELTCNAGDTVTSVLDKIIGIMGNYQYFYDVFGNFRFQQKANYLNMTNTAYWIKESSKRNKYEDMPTDVYEIETRLTKPVYTFEHNQFTTAYNNSLNYTNVKNDFVVWGYRKSVNSNIKIPCRFHLAVDKKPSIYQIHNNVMFYKDDEQIIRGKILLEEILYKDKEIVINASNTILFESSRIIIYGNKYAIFKYGFSSFEDAIAYWNSFLQNVTETELNKIQYIFININNEYYTSNFNWLNAIKDKRQFIPVSVKRDSETKEIVCFSFLPWYYNGSYSGIEKQNDMIIIKPGAINSEYFPNHIISISPVITQDWREQIYYQMLESERHGTDQNTELNNSYFQYYAQLKEEFPKIFDLSPISEENASAIGYKINMEKNPDQINYYLDFIDENSQLGGYSVNNIGRRAKIIDDNNQGINCVFEPTIPDVVYISSVLYSDKDLIALERKLINIGQDFTQIEPRIYNLFDVGGQLNSCFEKIKDLLYQYTHVNNTISITTLPIYYLQPNTRITVDDQPAGIYGDYIIQSISLPLDINSTMNINAYKALQKI